MFQNMEIKLNSNAHIILPRILDASTAKILHAWDSGEMSAPTAAANLGFDRPQAYEHAEGFLRFLCHFYSIGGT